VRFRRMRTGISFTVSLADRLRLQAIVAAPRSLQKHVFRSLIDLQAAINRFIAEYNDNDAKPFKWTADPDKSIAARNRGFQTLESIH
jgi:hypothetical protein